MSLGADARESALDTVLDEQVRKAAGLVKRLLRSPTPDGSLSADLFQVVDVLESSSMLRRSLVDPGAPEEARRSLVHGVFDGKISEAAVSVVAEAAAVRWPGPRTLLAAMERQAVRAELLRSDAQEQLEETEDELFRFARLVKSNPDLQDALSNRSVPVDQREELVRRLLTGKATEATITLATRGVMARERTFDHTLEGYVALAAEQKNRVIATVRVAKPLGEEQVTRLQAALSQQVGRPVFVQLIVDEQVLGGVRVELGDEVIEGTVASKLEDVRRLFS